MKKALVAAVVVLVVALAMAFSCPDEDSFHSWLRTNRGKQGGSLLERAAGSVLDAHTALTADYRDRVLWATVEARRGDEQRRYLGLFGVWFDVTR